MSGVRSRDGPVVDGGRSIGVGMLGHGLMGRAHSYALNSLRIVTRPCPFVPRLISVCGRDPNRVEAARERYGFDYALTDWRTQISDPRIDLLDNTGPNDLHVVPTISAIRSGKHVLCEKPLARSPDEAFDVWSEAERHGIVHMCGFNYRFFPAIQRARRLIADGALGEVSHFRSRFFQSSGLDGRGPDDWRTTRPAAGGGVLRDLGSHHIDLARLLVAEPVSVIGTLGPIRAPGSPDDPAVEQEFRALIEFANGATGTLEASSVAGGHNCTSEVEVEGSKSSLRFEMARLNELAISTRGHVRHVSVTEAEDPFMDWWYPPGHALGWGDSFIHEMDRMMRAIARECPIAPVGATFEDGYRCAEICAAIARSSASGRSEHVRVRSCQ